MAVHAPAVIPEQTADAHAVLLGVLGGGLAGSDVSVLLVKTVGLLLRFPELGIPRHLPPVLEVRGADGRIRATVAVAGRAGKLIYRVRPARDAPPVVFPVDDAAEAHAFLVAEARDWGRL